MINELYRYRLGLLAVTVSLLAAATGPHAARAEVKVVGCDVMAPDSSADAAAPASISIVGARNGTFCGKVIVLSGEPIGDLKATAGELKQPGGAAIPASAVSARCATGWGSTQYTWPQGPDILLDSLPAGSAATRVPVWVSVKVPKDAQPGVYTGQVTVQAKGLSATAVAVRLDVRDWALPDPQNYRTWVELMQQPDTLALEYNVPLWSDRHWELIAQSLRLIADTGSRVVYVPLIAQTNYGNAESMVRWIKKGGGRYEHDFSIVDRYLDVVEKNLGKPKITIFYAWETSLRRPKGAATTVPVKGAEGSYEWREATAHNKMVENQSKGPIVTVVDPATGKTENVNLPRYESPEAKALWKPVWDGVRQRMAKRGWEKSMMVGSFSDYYPTKEETAVLNDLSGGAPWAGCAHHVNSVKDGVTLGKVGSADIGYAAVALDMYFALNPAKAPQRYYGWKYSTLHAQYHRFHVFNGPLFNVRYEAERLITGNKRGLAHIGADFWPCVRDKAGRRKGNVTDRYPESYWHSLNIMGWMLAPGPDGPVGTARLDIFREGIQECEARIAIETALSDGALKSKLGADLANRAQDYLDERMVAIWKGVGVSDEDRQKTPLLTAYRDWYFGVGKRLDTKGGLAWFLASGWQDRNAKLFDLAAEVERKLGK